MVTNPKKGVYTSYSSEYEKEFDYFRVCHQIIAEADLRFCCFACKYNFLFSAGWINYIKKHTESTAHKENDCQK